MSSHSLESLALGIDEDKKPRRRWGLPASINQSYMDHEVVISSRGWKIKPLPIKVLLFYLFWLLGLMWTISSTFYKDGPVWLTALYLIWSIGAMLYFGGYTKAKEMRIMQVVPLASYLPKKNRHVRTRLMDNPGPFLNIARINDVSDDGLIEFTDGMVARAYLIVGSASVMLFDEDRDSILGRVASFWEKVPMGSEFIFMTTKEPQRVKHQIVHLQDQMDRLEVRDPELFDLLDEKYKVLDGYVGQRFKSIHQYLIIKASTYEQLRLTTNVLESEYQNSNLMFKSVTQLRYRGVIDMFKPLYQGREGFNLKSLTRSATGGGRIVD